MFGLVTPSLTQTQQHDGLNSSQKLFTQSLIIQDGKYEGRSESKERLAIQRYLLIIGKKQNMQVLSHTFTYFSI